MGFAPQAVIDHAALRHNLRQVRELAPNSRVWAVVKANAYGHGLARVAQSLEASDGFAVARIEEALQLRELGINRPLLILLFGLAVITGASGVWLLWTSGLVSVGRTLAIAAGGSIGAWTICGWEYSRVKTLAAPLSAFSASPWLRTGVPAARAEARSDFS